MSSPCRTISEDCLSEMANHNLVSSSNRRNSKALSHPILDQPSDVPAIRTSVKPSQRAFLSTHPTMVRPRTRATTPRLNEQVPDDGPVESGVPNVGRDEVTEVVIAGGSHVTPEGWSRNNTR